MPQAKFYFYLFFIYVLLSCTIVQAQVSIQSYSLEDGLSDRTIKDLYQSKNGLIWMATDDGLCKFDGRSFLTFNNHFQNPNRINGTVVDRIYALSDSTILLSYAKLPIVDIFDTNTFALNSVQLPFDGNGNWQSISANNKRQLYYYTHYQDTLHLYTLKDEKLKIINQVYCSPINHFTIFDSLSYCISTPDEFQQYELPNKQINASPQLKQELKNELDLLSTDINNQILFSPKASGNLYRIDKSNLSKELIYKAATTIRIRKLWKDNQGDLLIGLSNDTHPFYPDIEKLLLVDTQNEVQDWSAVLEQVDSKINKIISTDFNDLSFIATHNGFFQSRTPTKQA